MRDDIASTRYPTTKQRMDVKSDDDDDGRRMGWDRWMDGWVDGDELGG